MTELNLQEKTKAEIGKIEIYWFENDAIGLKKTLFHRIKIPLQSFDSGIEYESQPVETEIVMEWLNLNLKDPCNLDGIVLTSTPEDGREISIYVGNAHNSCDLKTLRFKKNGVDKYDIDGSLLIDFESEGVAKNEEFNFNTQLELNQSVKE